MEFVKELASWIKIVDDYVWGWPTILLLLGTGLYLTVMLRGLQFRQLPHALGLIFHRDPNAEGDISHFGALMTALAATVGTGNIVGVAGAILAGGPGAIFWMWMIGLVGMATKYSEAVLAVRFREKGPYGMRGGPMYYISRGVGWPWLGAVFAVFAACASFGIGNMTQSNSVAANFFETFHFPPMWTGIILTVLTGVVILGGIRSIARFTEVLVPVMIVGYCGAGIVALLLNFRQIPHAFGMIFHYAFTSYDAAAGGMLGYVISQTMRYGIARGIFSNESGLGSSPIAAAAAQTRDPATQALVSMTQTFIDTIVVCTMTALVILTSTHWQEAGMLSNKLTAASFEDTLGRPGAIIVTIAAGIFAYSTLIGWSYYGEKAVEYLAGPKVIIFYRILFVLAINVGTMVEMPAFKERADFEQGVKMIWGVADILNGLMALPNLVGLIVLAGVVKMETDHYFRRKRATL